MHGGYSIDLRERVVGYIDSGGRKRDACRIFKIGENTLYTWLRRRRLEGSIAARRVVRPAYKIDSVKLTAYIEAHSDHTLAEIAKEFKVSGEAIRVACKRLKITRKKNKALSGAKGRRKGKLLNGIKKS